MKRIAAAAAALAMLAGAVALTSVGAEAQTGGEPYILEIGNAKVAAGNDRVRFTHSTTDIVDWQQIYAVPVGRRAVKFSVRQIDDETAVVHLASAAPSGGIAFEFQVIVWEP
jgi:hypothetical protein